MQIVELESFDLVGIEVHADWQSLWREMPDAWQSLFARADEIKGRRDAVFLDASLEVNDGIYRQLVGAKVEKDTVVPNGMTRVVIPAQRYLHFRHEGSLREIAASFGKMYAWGRENGMALDEFKLDFGYTPAGDEAAHDLYVRVIE